MQTEVVLKSESKVVLDLNTIARWTEKHLGRALIDSREITDGWFNTIHILEMADARDKSVHLPWPEARLRDFFQAAQADLDVVKTPRLILRDLHDGNVLVKPDSLKLAAFLDTDRAIWGDPLMEFYFRSIADASAAWKAAYRLSCIESGKTFPPETPGADRRLALYDIYLGLVLVIETAYRNYGEPHRIWVCCVCDQALSAFTTG